MLDADTLKKLEERQQQLATVFIAECETAEWPEPKTQQGRGDRYWHKKNAAATATLIVKIQSILDVALRKPLPVDPLRPDPHAEEDELKPGAMAEAAMAEAKQILDRTQGRFKKT